MLGNVPLRAIFCWVGRRGWASVDFARLKMARVHSPHQPGNPRACRVTARGLGCQPRTRPVPGVFQSRWRRGSGPALLQEGGESSASQPYHLPAGIPPGPNSWCGGSHLNCSGLAGQALPALCFSASSRDQRANPTPAGLGTTGAPGWSLSFPATAAGEAVHLGRVSPQHSTEPSVFSPQENL